MHKIIRDRWGERIYAGITREQCLKPHPCRLLWRDANFTNAITRILLGTFFFVLRLPNLVQHPLRNWDARPVNNSRFPRYALFSCWCIRISFTLPHFPHAFLAESLLHSYSSDPISFHFSGRSRMLMLPALSLPPAVLHFVTTMCKSRRIVPH